MCFNIEHDENQKSKQMTIMKITSKHPYIIKNDAINHDKQVNKAHNCCYVLLVVNDIHK